MYQRPSRNLPADNETKLNLIPILDGIFILIFFLLVTSNFSGLFNQESDAPVSSSLPLEQKKSLDLMIELNKNQIRIFKEGETNPFQTFEIDIQMKENFYSFHQTMIDFKKKYPKEDSVVFNPSNDVEYDLIITLIDQMREIFPTDEPLYEKYEGGEKKLEHLFKNVVLGNL